MPYVTFDNKNNVTGVYANMQPGAKLLDDDDPAVVAHTEKAEWADVRLTRNLRLIASDRTQLADYSGDATAWAKYRQALRDVPQKFQTPREVVWPTVPD